MSINKIMSFLIHSYNLRLILRELIGLYRYFKARKKYSSSKSSVYKSDYSTSAIKKGKEESFKSFFLRVENARNLDDKKISKNVNSNLTYFSTASQLIPFLTANCDLKVSKKVLDYGSGGLRCGFGLLDFLKDNSYACADITDKFLNRALDNSDLLKHLFLKKKGIFYKIGAYDIPKDFYDLVISIYVVCHIPKEDLDRYFKSINKYLKINGIFYFDFLPSFLYLAQNSTTFTYPYRTIINNLRNNGFSIDKTIGSGIIAKKVSNL